MGMAGGHALLTAGVVRAARDSRAMLPAQTLIMPSSDLLKAIGGGTHHCQLSGSSPAGSRHVM